MNKYDFFPPARGLINSYPRTGLVTSVEPYQHTGKSPYIEGPPIADSTHFKQTETQFNLSEGWEFLHDMDKDNFCMMIASYKNTGAPIYDLLVAMDDLSGTTTDLYTIELNTAGKTTTSRLQLETTANPRSMRYSWVQFRNRFFIATRTNRLMWYDPALRLGRRAGVAAPTTNLSAAIGAAGVLTGDYLYKYTNVNDQGHESNPSAVSTVVSATSDQIDLTSIDTGPTGTTSRRVYRTAAGGSTFLFLTTIADNVTTTFTDNIADSALGSLLEEDNDLPPTGLQAVTATPSRLALLDEGGTVVYFSKIDSTTAITNWEAYPSALSVNLPFIGGTESGRALAWFEDALYVFGATDTYRILGDIGTGIKVEKIFPEVGIFNNTSVIVVPGKGMYWISGNCKFFHSPDGIKVQDISDDILEILNEIKALSTAQQKAYIGLEYDARNKIIYFTGGYAWRGRGFQYNLQTKQFMGPPAWRYAITHYSNYFDCVYGYFNDDPATAEASGNQNGIHSWSGFHVGTNPPTEPLIGTGGVYAMPTTPNPITIPAIQFRPWTPAPGTDVEFGWVELIVEGKYLISNVVPTLMVQWFLDGSLRGGRQMVDFSRGFSTGNYKASDIFGVTRTLRVPIHKIARTVTLIITVRANNASMINGVEIYGISVWARPLRPEGTDQGGYPQQMYPSYLQLLS